MKNVLELISKKAETMGIHRKLMVVFSVSVILTFCVCIYFINNYSISITHTQLTGGKTSVTQVYDVYDCEAELNKLNAEAVQQQDPRLVRVIKQCFLEAPAYSPYNLKQPDLKSFSQDGQDVYVDNLLNHVENGFFVECGAFDGEKISNTLLFEKNRKWTGLLIEPVPELYASVRSKNRKSFSVNACLSKSKYPVQMVMNSHRALSRLTNDQASKYMNNRTANKVVVQCFPFYSLILAAGRLKIDFFSLDIEGDELTVLKTIPWPKVDIKMLLVEHVHIKEGIVSLINFMASNNYIALPQMSYKARADIIFVKNGFEYNASFTYLSDVKTAKKTIPRANQQARGQEKTGAKVKNNTDTSMNRQPPSRAPNKPRQPEIQQTNSTQSKIAKNKSLESSTRNYSMNTGHT